MLAVRHPHRPRVTFERAAWQRPRCPRTGRPNRNCRRDYGSEREPRAAVRREPRRNSVSQPNWRAAVETAQIDPVIQTLEQKAVAIGGEIDRESGVLP